MYATALVHLQVAGSSNHALRPRTCASQLSCQESETWNEVLKSRGIRNQGLYVVSPGLAWDHGCLVVSCK